MSKRQRPKKGARHPTQVRTNHKWLGRCPSGKLRYRDRREARVALHNMMLLRLHGHTSRKECAYYRCKQCRGWHLTSRSYRY